MEKNISHSYHFLLSFPEELQEYMENFGAVSSCALKTDMETRKSRGFGFVVFKDASSIDKVIIPPNLVICNLQC